MTRCSCETAAARIARNEMCTSVAGSVRCGASTFSVVHAHYRWAAIHRAFRARTSLSSLSPSPPVCMWKLPWQSKQFTRCVSRRSGEQKQIGARDSPPAMQRPRDLVLTQQTRLISSPSEPACLYCMDDPKSSQRRVRLPSQLQAAVLKDLAVNSPRSLVLLAQWSAVDHSAIAGASLSIFSTRAGPGPPGE